MIDEKLNDYKVGSVAQSVEQRPFKPSRARASTVRHAKSRRGVQNGAPDSTDLHDVAGTGGRHSGEILVSPQDVHLFEQYTWRVHHDKRTAYAVATVRGPGFRGTVRMHRLIIRAKPGEFVDHINGNGLDNRRENLRICTHKQNARNRQKQRGTRSPYKGVTTSYSPTRPWAAQICVDSVVRNLGRFATQEEAARAYDAEALRHFGEFARLNFPVIAKATGGAR